MGVVSLDSAWACVNWRESDQACIQRLAGWISGDCTESYLEHRVLTVQCLVGLDLVLTDTILLGDLVRRELCALARKRLGDDDVAMLAM